MSGWINVAFELSDNTDLNELYEQMSGFVDGGEVGLYRDTLTLARLDRAGVTVFDLAGELGENLALLARGEFNSTTERGDITVFEVRDGLQRLNQLQGAEGAQGHDVAKQARREYDLSVYTAQHPDLQAVSTDNEKSSGGSDASDFLSGG